MTGILRIPTSEPYAYIEIQVEGTVDEIFAQYQEMIKTVKGGEGLPEKEFNTVVDRYLWGDGHMLADEFAAMNLDQQDFIQRCKRSRKRAEAKTK